MVRWAASPRARLGEVLGQVGRDLAEGVEDDGGFLEGNHLIHGAGERQQIVVEFGHHDVGRDADSPKRAKVATNHGRQPTAATYGPDTGVYRPREGCLLTHGY